MVFGNLFSSRKFHLKPCHAPNLSHTPITLTESSQSLAIIGKHAMGGVFDRYFFALSNGIKPVSLTFRNNLIHTRLLTGHERLINLQKDIEKAKSDLKLARRLYQRQKQISHIAENRAIHVKLMVMMVNTKEIKNLTEKMDYWKEIANQHEEKMVQIGKDALTLMDAALTSARDVEMLKAERDETRAQLELEKERIEAMEEHCDETVSSLYRSSEREKELLRSEVGESEETLRKKVHKIAELAEFRQECKQEMQEKDRQIAFHESSEVMVAVSRAMSSILSEMSEVELVGQTDWQNLGEKMQTLTDGMKRLLREVKIRREHSHRLNSRIYLMEQERVEFKREFNLSFYLNLRGL